MCLCTYVNIIRLTHRQSSAGFTECPVSIKSNGKLNKKQREMLDYFDCTHKSLSKFLLSCMMKRFPRSSGSLCGTVTSLTHEQTSWHILLWHIYLICATKIWQNYIKWHFHLQVKVRLQALGSTNACSLISVWKRWIIHLVAPHGLWSYVTWKCEKCRDRKMLLISASGHWLH